MELVHWIPRLSILPCNKLVCVATTSPLISKEKWFEEGDGGKENMSFILFLYWADWSREPLHPITQEVLRFSWQLRQPLGSPNGILIAQVIPSVMLNDLNTGTGLSSKMNEALLLQSWNCLTSLSERHLHLFWWKTNVLFSRLHWQEHLWSSWLSAWYDRQSPLVLDVWLQSVDGSVKVSHWFCALSHLFIANMFPNANADRNWQNKTVDPNIVNFVAFGTIAK